MGRSNKPTKWFKAVKKAFRSPSKERPASPDHQDTKDDADEKLLAKHELSPAPYQAPTPHPLPSYEIITHEEVEPENSRGQPLPTPEAVAPVMSANLPETKKVENVIKEENSSSHVDADVVEKHQDDDDDSTLSEEEEAAARIQLRFSEPMALKGLIRVQALVRGHQVRRQAATTLQTMEAIVRVQAVFRGRRVRMSKDGRAVRSRISKRRRLSSRAGSQYGDARRAPAFQDRELEETRDEGGSNERRRPTAYLLTQQLKRSAPNRSSLIIDCGPGQPHWGWEWLELWSNARPWEIRTLEEPKRSKSTKDSSKESRDYIEIIPGSRKNNSEYTTKEVDVNTLKVKYYEDYVPNPTPAMSRSSNPSSENKESSVKSASPMSEKREPAKASSPMSEKREPKRASSPNIPEKKEPAKASSPMSEKREPKRASSPNISEKKDPAIKSPRSLPDKKEPVSYRTSSSPFSEKKEPVSVRSSFNSHSDKKESSSRSSLSPMSQKKEPARSSTSSLSEKNELSAIPPTSPGLSEKREGDYVVSDWHHASPVAIPASPSASPTAYSHRTLPKPPPIEVPTRPNVEEERPIQVEPRTLEDLKSPVPEKSVQPSPAVSGTSIAAPPSPQASDTSIPVPATPPGVDSAESDPFVTMEHLALPDSAHSDHGGEIHEEFKNGDTHSSEFSASTGEHLPGEDTPSAKGSASASDNVVNGHASNGHQENGDSSKTRKGEKTPNGENGESPNVPNKKPTSRYMLLTESAKAKQATGSRSSSNPKTRAPDTPESPARTPKRYSSGGTPLVTSKGTDSPKTAFGTRKSTTFLNRGTPSPKGVSPKEKPAAREVETGAASPARRVSIGGADGKRWRT
ncbi:hypothetical protein M758_1G100700 [Ceratodon purpureus]|nr:hypothetical protein M758_1G100700 [Ceratodon purpureus]